MIHVCFGLHDAEGTYSKFTGTAMLSLFENHDLPSTRLPSITVHILHDNTLTNDNREKFSYIAGQYGQCVKFHNVEQLYADKFEEFKQLVPLAKDSTRTVGMFFRLLLASLLPEQKKVIYLDSDIVVNLDISELWRVELKDKVLAAVPEIFNKVNTMQHYLCNRGFVKREDFFNSGILIMNLEKLRLEEETLKRGIQFKVEHPKCDGNDQSILNYCFATQAVKLPLNFNVLVEYARMNNDFETADRICHYITSGNGKGILLDRSDPFNRLWMKYFIRTPWFDEDTIGRLYDGFRQVQVGLKQSMINVSAMMSGKSRAFFTTPDDLDAIKKIFFIRDDEEIIPAENQESLQKLIDAMRASRGQKVFFIVIPNFPFILLVQAGFIPGKDFVNGMEFLPMPQGSLLNSYNLIKAM